MPTWSNLGINATHLYDQEPNLSTHLNIIYNAGIRNLRCNIPAYTTEAFNTSFRDRLRNVVTTALSIGFQHVITGYTVSGVSNLTNTSMTTTYHDAFTSMATYYQGLTGGEKVEIILGNEDDPRVDGSTVTTAQYEAYVRGTLATDVKAIFTKGMISYNTHSGYYANWKASGLGGLDRFGLNLYGSSVWANYIPAMKADFGTRGYLSEWNANDNGRDDFSSDEAFNQALFIRYDQLQKLNIPYYLFGYDFGSAGEKWAMYLLNLTYRSAWYMLINGRKEYGIF